jgi:hypothetical protein
MRTRFALICAAVAPLAAFAFAPTAGAVSLASPDPGGDPNAAVPLPPPPGQYMGFNDDAAHSVHGLTPPEYVHRAQDAGANLIRASLDWRDAEPALNFWSKNAWDRWQGLYDQALAHGLTPMFTIGFAPVWARELQFQECGEHCRYPPSRLMNGQWAEFAAEVAHRFPLAVIEVWNEPNLLNFWGSGADPQRYAELLAIAHDAIKQVSPSTMVLGGALANVQRTGGGHMALGEFLDAAYSAAPSIAGNLDALSFHPYPEGVGLGANTLFAKSFADMRTVKAAHGDASTSLFVSEVGASTGAPESLSESEQAATLQALYRRAMTMGDVLGVVFHRLIEPADTSANEWELGVAWLRYDPDRDPPPPPPREVYCRFAIEARHSYPGCPDPPPPAPAPQPIPTPPPQGPQAGAFDSPPETGVRRLRKRRADRRRPRFELLASEPASFECAIDRRRFRPCRSPYRTPRLRRGRHLLQVRAVDLAGQLDPTPAKRRFKVRRRRP